MIKKIRGSSRNIKYSRSASQVKHNRAFRTCCTWWRENFTPTLVMEWFSYGTDRQTAFNAFLSVNLVRVYNDLPILPTPPPEV